MKRLFKIVLPLLLLLYLFIPLTNITHADSGEIIYTGTNTNLAGDDDSAGPFNLGFTFNFFGTNYTQLYANINGTLNFTSGFSGYSNYDLSSGSAPNNSIYPFWDDLITSLDYSAKPILYTTIGSGSSQQFIAQWTNMYFYNTTVEMGTFQVILNQSTNVIQFQYRDLLGGSRSNGNSATVGIKGSSSYSEYSFNTANLTQGQAISFTPNGLGGYIQNTNATYDEVYLAQVGSPSTPTLINPQDGTTGATLTPTFEWGSADNATSYNLLVSTVSDFSSTVVNQTGLTNTSYTLGSSLNTSTLYYWRVAAVNDIATTLSSSRTFTTGTDVILAPDTPTNLVSSTLLGDDTIGVPTNDTLSMTLHDSDGNQQLRFRIQIASDNTFSTLLIDYRSPFGAQGTRTFTYGETGGTYLVGSGSTSLTNGSYYIRIMAENQGAVSSAWNTVSGVSFVINTAITPTPTTTPTPTATSTDTITSSPTPTATQTVTPTTSPANLAGASDYIGVIKTIQGVSGYTLDYNTPTFSGTGTPGSTITVTVHSNPIVVTTIVKADGTWSVSTPYVPNGLHTLNIVESKDGTSISLAKNYSLAINYGLPVTGENILPILLCAILGCIGGILCLLYVGQNKKVFSKK